MRSRTAIFVLFKTVLFQIYVGAQGLSFLVFEILKYKHTEQWVKICLDLEQWEKNLINSESVEKKSTIQLLDKDFDRIKGQNNGDQE